MNIRRAVPSDAARMSELILAQAPLITLEPDGKGADAVLASMQTSALEENIASTRFSYWVAETHGNIQGTIGLRDGRHLYQLFVRRDLHRTGIGKRLWQHMLDTLGADAPACITVNASPYGLPAYERLGFMATGPRTEINGIAFIPMSFSLTSKGTSP